MLNEARTAGMRIRHQRSEQEQYELASEVVEAAILYFLLHPNEITARIEGNALPDAIPVG